MAGHNGAILMGFAQGDEGLILSGVAALLGWLDRLRAEAGHAADPARLPA